MKEIIGEGWFNKIGGEFDKEYMLSLRDKIKARRLTHIVYPAQEDIFNAYKYTHFEDVKVVILGQDPYVKENEAHGLAFSSKDGKYTPSLRKIQEAVENDCYNGLKLDWDNNLIRWAKQGVFLLNTILTVDKGESLSHKDKGWEEFTLETIKQLNNKGGVIFLLWGANARQYKQHINISNVVLECEHPVAASYNGRKWENFSCFSKVNEILALYNEKEIEW